MSAGIAAAGLPKMWTSAPACSVPAAPLSSEVRGHGAAVPAGPWCGPLAGPLAGQVPSQVPGQAPGRGSSPLQGPLPGHVHGQAPSAVSASLGEQFARALNEQGGDDEIALPAEAGAPSGLLPWPPVPTPLAPGAAPNRGRGRG